MTGYLYQGSPLLERLNAQIREWRTACHGDEGPHGRGDCTDGRWARVVAAYEWCGQPTSALNLCSRPAGHPGKHVAYRRDRRNGSAPDRARMADRGRP